MTTSLLIIIIAIITLLSVIVILNLILPKTELSKGVIINKHTEPKHKINHVQIIGEIPVCYDETTPAKYYLDISGYDHNNKTQTITITNPRSQGGPRFQSGEELANSVGKINAYHSL